MGIFLVIGVSTIPLVTSALELTGAAHPLPLATISPVLVVAGLACVLLSFAMAAIAVGASLALSLRVKYVDRGLRAPLALIGDGNLGIWGAQGEVWTETKRDELMAWLKSERQEPAAATLLRDWDDFVAFYDFQQEHWLHLCTTNPLESVFAGVRLRTDVAKRARKRENALYLVLKVVQRLGRNWRALNGGPELMQMVAEDAVFRDGVLQEPDQETEVRIA